MTGETIRQRKLADQIKKQVSWIVDQKLKDPRKGLITITHVKLSGDLRIASIYFTALGDEEQHRLAAEVLDNAKHFIRSELAPMLKVRFVPELRFFYDDTLDYSMHIEGLLKKVKEQDKKHKE